MHYTSAQQRAINAADDQLQIIACAGSGKTHVVTARIINILRVHRADGITPENIVAFTFTEKAAGELKDRITKVYQEAFGNIEGLAGMYIGTIHGFCLDLLQRYLFQYLKYDVLDDVRQRLFIDRNFQKSGMGSLGLRRYLDSGLYVRILSTLREAEADAGPFDGHPTKIALDMYESLLDSHKYFDYDEIMLRSVVELMANEDLRSQVAARVKYVTVDEYQDVNPIQELLVRELYKLGANLCVVGDDDQNVYQWRGSDVDNIVTFAQRYDGVVQVPLETNFRSTDAIVQVARKAVEVNPTRLAKEMRSGGSRAYSRGDLLALQFTSPEQEAKWIADKILAMRGLPYPEADGASRGLSWSDCAVLLRSVKRTAAPIVDALRARDIPFVVTGIAGLFDTLEAQAANAIFQFMTCEIDEEELRSRWRDADVGLNEEDLTRGLKVLVDGRTFEEGKRFSIYNLQRTYLDFLEAVQLREYRVPGGRGEIVFYNLGKFSQVISDYETIHFKSAPEEKYRSFVEFLRYQAPDVYPEGGQDQAYAVPDAVRIMTVHAAKGMEFPVVFLPCLQRNRFPSRNQLNQVWKYVPKEAIHNADRYDGKVEDERRLFYVAITRSEKYLFASWAPTADNQLYRRPSPFFEELTQRDKVLTREPAAPAEQMRLAPQPRRPQVNVELSFSDLKYLFECPYQFKLRLLYGFNAPIDEALGYGRSLHNVLAEIHRRALVGDIVGREDVPGLVDDHLNVRYAYPQLEENLRNAAVTSAGKYLREHEEDLTRLEHVEETVQLTLPGGVVVDGRIDLIRRTDTDEVAIVDFKSNHRAQAEDVTRLQLHVYALGYEQRFGQRADLIEVCNLDEGGSRREMVDDTLLQPTVNAVVAAGQKLRDNRLERLEHWCDVCARCDYAGICRDRAAAAVTVPTRRSQAQDQADR